VLRGEARERLGVLYDLRDGRGHRRQRHVTHRKHQPLRRLEILTRRRQALGDPRWKPGARQERSEGAVLGDEARSGLVPDAGHAGEAVGGISAQQRVVAVGPARDAVASRDLRLVDLEEL
jgi:hypothetical protein